MTESEQNLVRNPMVEYLNSLRTQERGANPTYVHENRAAFLDSLRAEFSWFPSDQSLQIPTKLDALVAQLAGPNPAYDVVFFTGDAGDGKTAACAQLAGALGHPNELRSLVEVVGSWLIVKDASELPSVDLEQLLQRHHLDRDAGSPRIMIAINEGRLRRLAERLYRPGHRFRDEVLDLALQPELSVEGAVPLHNAMVEQRTMVVNFRHRSLVRSAVPSFLTRWTPRELWETSSACSGCPARTHCPILANVQDLREELPRTRIADLLMSAFLSGQRLPLRRLQAFLSLATTGGLGCEHVQLGPLAADGAALDRLRYRYFEAIFRTDAHGPVVVQPEAVCFALHPLDPAMSSDRPFDELVALRVRDAALGDSVLSEAHVGPLERDALTSIGASNDPDESVVALSDRLAKVTRSLRRWRALTAEPAKELARALHATALLEAYGSGGEGEDLRRAVVEALNRLHLVDGIKNDRITRRQIDAAAFRQPARRALELDLGTEFTTRLVRTPAMPQAVEPFVEHVSSDIFLCAHVPSHPDSEAQLLLDARLVNALLGVREGYQQLGALGAYRRDLARFFAQLLELSVAAGNQPVLSVLVSGTRYRVTTHNGKLDFQAE